MKRLLAGVIVALALAAACGGTEAPEVLVDGTAIVTPTPFRNSTQPETGGARYTYLTLGDSVAAGVGASGIPQTYAEVLFRALHEEDPSLSHHLNLAIPGETSSTLLGAQMEAAVAELETGRVRIVTLSIGANDLLVLLGGCRDQLASGPCREAAAAALRDVEENLDEAIARIEMADPMVEIVLLTYYNPLAPVLPETAEYVAQLNAVIEAEAAEESLPLVDIFPAFDGREEDLTHIFSQDVHPNDAGHQVIAEAVASVILTNGLLGD